MGRWRRSGSVVGWGVWGRVLGLGLAVGLVVGLLPVVPVGWRGRIFRLRLRLRIGRVGR